jgi:hypothetical protein
MTTTLTKTLEYAFTDAISVSAAEIVRAHRGRTTHDRWQALVRRCTAREVAEVVARVDRQETLQAAATKARRLSEGHPSCDAMRAVVAAIAEGRNPTDAQIDSAVAAQLEENRRRQARAEVLSLAAASLPKVLVAGASSIAPPDVRARPGDPGAVPAEPLLRWAAGAADAGDADAAIVLAWSRGIDVDCSGWADAPGPDPTGSAGIDSLRILSWLMPLGQSSPRLRASTILNDRRASAALDGAPQFARMIASVAGGRSFLVG